ncbi:hypothetical protein BOTBODRAFT_39585 [Botryobasidium botryosum FD-172 SS1]|uniref:Uncharacterized protein n=1 Tax=Botryobasidium botryosum (strain FD-172 SS1) TaxID=930990 RepID=A0A067M4G5_BOTB1|nr:hypothetical protein BOTBODRAFT_39585 [Botryobasidium botryosum FD-172 SS1]
MSSFQSRAPDLLSSSHPTAVRRPCMLELATQPLRRRLHERIQTRIQTNRRSALTNDCDIIAASSSAIIFAHYLVIRHEL